MQPCQVPDSQAVHVSLSAPTDVACATLCDADDACLGFMFGDGCYLYSFVPKLVDARGSHWYQKRGTAPIPAPKPTCKQPPPQIPCSVWAETNGWKRVKCNDNGSNCVLLLDVMASNGMQASSNILPFVPPKDMEVPKASIIATFGKIIGNEVMITLSSTATAVYVVLTTLAEGRFSENAFVLEADTPRDVSFVSWGELDIDKMALLRSSLRVEHLSDNLCTGRTCKTSHYGIDVWI
jgi:hypothetical protein